MSICLCTLVLNEMQWLPSLYEQHKDWPGLITWVFVESADIVYARMNPELVSDQGLSVDGTSEFLSDLSTKDNRIIYIPHGFSKAEDLAQSKCISRNRYLQAIAPYYPDLFYVLDADEFIPKRSQERINYLMRGSARAMTAFCFRQRHIWHPLCLSTRPLFTYEVAGGFWDIPHCRGWRWESGLSYRTNHNTPETDKGVLLDRRMKRYDQVDGTPECVHMGFASLPSMRSAKHLYYAARGENKDPKRKWYVDSRACYLSWKPGDKLPRGAKVMFYDGPIPEALQNNQHNLKTSIKPY